MEKNGNGKHSIISISKKPFSKKILYNNILLNNFSICMNILIFFEVQNVIFYFILWRSIFFFFRSLMKIETIYYLFYKTVYLIMYFILILL